MNLSSSGILDYGIAFVLPGITAFVAGLLRQDHFPTWLNDTLAYVFIFLLSFAYVLAQGKITGNPVADFTLILSYTGVVMRWSALKNLQSYLQSNWFSFGTKANADGTPAPSVPTLNTQAIAASLVEELHRSGLFDPVFQLLVKWDNALAQKTGIAQPVQQSQPPVQVVSTPQVENPWSSGTLSGVQASAPQVPFPPLQRNWTSIGLTAVPPNQGQSQ